MSTSTAVVHPATGEILDLADTPTTDLAAVYDELVDFAGRLTDYRAAIVAEVCRRLDANNARTERVGDWTLETNAPTVEEYLTRELRVELEALVEAGILEQGAIDRCIVTPAPPPPEPKVDKREVNKLKRHPDRRVLEALSRSRVVRSATRKLTVKRAEP